MSIKYQLQEVTQADGKTKLYGKVITNKTVTTKDLVRAIKTRGSTVTEADMAAVIATLTEVCYEAVLSGHAVQVDKLFTLYPVMKGVFTNRKDHYNPKKQSLTIRACAPKELRKQIKATGTVERIEPINTKPYLTRLEDIPGDVKSTQVVPGKIYKVKGERLKINLDREDEGLFLVQSNNKEVMYKVTQYVLKSLSEIVFVMPVIDVDITQVTLKIMSRSRKNAKFIKDANLSGVLPVVQPEA